MPQILGIILSLLGWKYGGALAGGAIKKAIPSLFKLGAKQMPKALAKIPGLGGTLGGVGAGAAGLAAGFGAPEIPRLLGFGDDQGNEGPSVPDDPGMEDAIRALRESQSYGAEEAQSLQSLYQQSEITNVLSSLGIDPDEFFRAAQPTRGGVV